MLVTVFFCNLNLHLNKNEPTATLPSTGSALSPWQHLPWTQILVSPIPISQGQAHGAGFALSAIGSLVWGAKKRPIKKKNTATSTYLLYLAGTIQRYNKVHLHKATYKKRQGKHNHKCIGINSKVNMYLQNVHTGGHDSHFLLEAQCIFGGVP